MSSRRLVAFTLLVAAWPRPALGIPRFSVREGLPCIACHVNPSGGGMRNRYGRYVFETTQLAAFALGGVKKLLSVDIGDSLSIGADSRTAFIHQRAEAPKSKDVSPTKPVDSLFQMQADIYFAVRLFSERLTLYYDQGVYGAFEAFGLYEHPFPRNIRVYAKVGRYNPSYGLRLPNHNLFVRQEIGFGPREMDVGGELGLYLGPLLLQVGIVGGAGPERQFDDNLDKGVVGRLELLGRWRALRIMAGASAYYNITGDRTESGGKAVDTRSKNLRAGVHWGLGLGRFAYLGEADIVKIDPFRENTKGAKELSFSSYQELATLVFRGLDLMVNYEFNEPDLRQKSGRLHRLSGGLEFFPVPFAEILLLYRHIFASGPAGQKRDGFDEFVGMVHLFF